MIIRLATSEDAHGIARVHVLGWQTGYRGLVSDTLLDGLSVDRRAAFWKDILSQPRANQRTFIAEQSEEIRGFVTCGRCRDEDSRESGELQAIYVLPEHWASGIGSALHDACIEALRVAAFADATLWVVDGNERALRFYAKHGWTRDGAGKVEEWDGATLQEVRLRRAL
ncbi:MAG TPA: GNAT family N-acetyltransferase [Terriglobia bacterium]|nr:GNAT family N-acetyltransferase [Terriglobia bacterium]